MKQLFATAAFAVGLATAGFAADRIMVEDAYARATTPSSPAGAAFMMITNHSGTDDRLVGAATDAASRVELHTHKEDAGGVMRMLEVEEGFALPAGETLELVRGGNHVMLMGLVAPLEHGADVTITLEFETAGALEIVVPVDLERQPEHGAHGGHSGHGGHADHSDHSDHGSAGHTHSN